MPFFTLVYFLKLQFRIEILPITIKSSGKDYARKDTKSNEKGRKYANKTQSRTKNKETRIKNEKETSIKTVKETSIL